jgi:NADH:ubiquinone reductase (H+-translocating)
MDRDGRKRIVILGGGFGALYAALRLGKTLARDPDVDILLVNRETFFLFTPLLHDVAAGDLDLTHIVTPVRKLLARVQFFHGDVDAIDLPGRTVVVSHGAEHHAHEVGYEQLVMALGSLPNFLNLPGLQARALTMKSLGDAI